MRGPTVGSPIVEFPEAPARHDNRMGGVNLRVELWMVFDIILDLEERLNYSSMALRGKT